MIEVVKMKMIVKDLSGDMELVTLGPTIGWVLWDLGFYVLLQRKQKYVTLERAEWQSKIG